MQGEGTILFHFFLQTGKVVESYQNLNLNTNIGTKLANLSNLLSCSDLLTFVFLCDCHAEKNPNPNSSLTVNVKTALLNLIALRFNKTRNFN